MAIVSLPIGLSIWRWVGLCASSCSCTACSAAAAIVRWAAFDWASTSLGGERRQSASDAVVGLDLAAIEIGQPIDHLRRGLLVEAMAIGVMPGKLRQGCSEGSDQLGRLVDQASKRAALEFIGQHRSLGCHRGIVRLAGKQRLATKELCGDEAVLLHRGALSVTCGAPGHAFADDEQRIASLARAHDRGACREM